MTPTEAIQTLRELDAQIISPREPKSTFLQIAEAFEEATNHCLCAYCGAKLPKDSAAVMAHIDGCEKHPTQKFLQDLDKAKSLAEEAMTQAKETGEAWEQLAACWPTIQVDCDDQIAAAQFIVAEHEKLRAELKQSNQCIDELEMTAGAINDEADRLKSSLKKCVDLLQWIGEVENSNDWWPHGADEVMSAARNAMFSGGGGGSSSETVARTAAP